MVHIHILSKVKLKCFNCGEEFERFPSQVSKINFCSRKCAKEYAQRDSVKTLCDVCKKEIVIPHNQYIHSKHHFCSNECRAKGISLFYSGENNPCYDEDNYKSIRCDYCNQEYKMLISAIKKNQKHFFCSNECKNNWQGENVRGKNHPNYNPNMSEFDRVTRREYSEYWQWRKSVYKRDNHTCQCCGDNTGHNLRAHHLFNYSTHFDLRTDIDNGITLCDPCHRLFHKIYGNQNNTKEQMNEFIDTHRKAS